MSERKARLGQWDWVGKRNPGSTYRSRGLWQRAGPQTSSPLLVDEPDRPLKNIHLI